MAGWGVGEGGGGGGGGVITVEASGTFSQIFVILRGQFHSIAVRNGPGRGTTLQTHTNGFSRAPLIFLCWVSFCATHWSETISWFPGKEEKVQSRIFNTT